MEARDLLSIGFDVARTGPRWQMVGINNAEYLAGFRSRECFQPNAVRQMRIQSTQASFFEPLAGQEKVDMKGASEASHGDEKVGEVRVLGKKLGEFVEDDEQGRERFKVRVVCAGFVVVVDIGVVSAGTEYFLSAVEFTTDGIVHALDQGGFFGQVGDDSARVWEPIKPQEGRTAFEVDEHKVQFFRRVRDRQRKDQGFEQFGFSRPSSPDAQAVRSHAAVCGFFEVQEQRPACIAQSEWHQKTLPSRLRRGVRLP